MIDDLDAWPIEPPRDTLFSTVRSKGSVRHGGRTIVETYEIGRSFRRTQYLVFLAERLPDPTPVIFYDEWAAQECCDEAVRRAEKQEGFAG